ncbi:hypothetical protein CN233_35615 [Sinorhizobium meliloti]|uniref:hypothetical protein n=1 Tax=Rhizobium meliloti TaxID=382 RepID=UPI000FDB1342|nr:hypothetical protein [Sinorhizobium meliloti]RVG20025.1 hypothetical protein CN233_35615 [Sinorhizobium meliloti]
MIFQNGILPTRCSTPRVLQPFYDKSVALCAFVGKNSKIPFSKTRPEYFRFNQAPAPLLALCALMLFVSDWDLNIAIGKFAKLLNAPEPADFSHGNVIGLNPFHDYAAARQSTWEQKSRRSLLLGSIMPHSCYRSSLVCNKNTRSGNPHKQRPAFDGRRRGTPGRGRNQYAIREPDRFRRLHPVPRTMTGKSAATNCWD